MIIISTSVGIDNVIIIWFQPNDWLIDFLLTNFYHCVLISFINKYISWLIDLHCALIYSFLRWEIGYNLCLLHFFVAFSVWQKMHFVLCKLSHIYSTSISSIYLSFSLPLLSIYIFIYPSDLLVKRLSVEVKTYQSIYLSKY